MEDRMRRDSCGCRGMCSRGTHRDSSVGCESKAEVKSMECIQYI